MKNSNLFFFFFAHLLSLQVFLRATIKRTWTQNKTDKNLSQILRTPENPNQQ